MSIGIWKFADRVNGAEFSAGKDAKLQRTIDSFTDLKKGDVVGVPSSDLLLENLFISETNPKKVREIANLQLDFHLPEAERENQVMAWVGYSGEGGTGLVILGAPKPELPKPKAIFPAHLAPYALAHRQKLISAETNTLVIHFLVDQVMSVTTEGEDLVFFRTFANSDDLSANLKLCCQSVYPSDERHFVETNQVVVIGGSEADHEKVKAGFGKSVTITRLSAEQLLPDGQEGTTPGEVGEKLLVPLGLVYASEIANLSRWNLLQQQRPLQGQVLVTVVKVAILLMIAFPVYFGLDILANRLMISRIESKMQETNNLYRRVAKASRDVSLMKNFLQDSGRKLVGPDICHEVFTIIDKCRPDGLWLTSFAGRPDQKMSANGKSGNYGMLVTFIEKLNAEADIKNLKLIFANASDNGQVDFQVVFSYDFPRQFGPDPKPEGEGGQ